MKWIRNLIERGMYRVVKLLTLADLHATRITLTTAEILLVNDFINHSEWFSVQPLLMVLPEEVWVAILLATGATQSYLVIRGRYHQADALIFAGWDTMLWVFMTSLLVVQGDFPSGPQVALTCSATWIFLRCSFRIYGNRSSDYTGDRRYSDSTK